MNTAAADVSDAEKARIDAWIVANNLNQYGDSADTMYLGGTPLFNERTARAGPVNGGDASSGGLQASSVPGASGTGQPGRGPQAMQLVAAMSIPGTRKWLDGSLLTSSGHSVIDKVCGGGYQSGSLVLIEEDVSGQHARTLAQLFAAEGLACGHKVILAGHDGRVHAPDLLPSLPLNVSKGSRDMLTLAATAEAHLHSAAAAEEGGTEESPQQQEGVADPTGAGLQNAWQYKKYLATTAATSTSGGVGDVGQALVKYGHTYDLGRKVPAAIVAEALESGQIVPLPPANGVWGGPGLPCLQKLPPLPPTEPGGTGRGAGVHVHGKGKEGARGGSSGSSLHFMDALIELQTDVDPGDPGLETLATVGAQEARKQAVRQGVAELLAHVASHTDKPAAGSTQPVITVDSLPAAQSPHLHTPAAPPVYQRFLHSLQPHCTGQGQTTLSRLLVLGMGGPQWDGAYRPLDHPGLEPGTRRPVLRGEVLEAYTPLLTAIQQMKAMVETASMPAQPGAARPPGVVAFLTVPTWLLPICIAERVRALASVVLKVYAFGEPGYALSTAHRVVTSSTAASTGTAPEFAEFTGLLLVRRSGRLEQGVASGQGVVAGGGGGGGVPMGTGIGLGMPEARTWLFKRDKRKLTIELPHLPPEGAGGPPPPAPVAHASLMAPLPSASVARGTAYPLTAPLAIGEAGLVQLQVPKRAGGGGPTEPLDYDEEPTELDPVQEAFVAALGVDGAGPRGGGAGHAIKTAMACASATAGKGGALDF